MRWAYTAALLAFASAGVSLSWTLGGPALLDTVGGEGGAIDPEGGVDRHALRWHVLVWDPWFLAWGIALGAAGLRRRRRR